MEQANNEEEIISESGNYLKNKLAITDPIELSKQERVITSEKIFALLLDPIKEIATIDETLINPDSTIKFGDKLFLAIHKYLFNDIYYFAGEIRKNIIYAKGRGNASMSNYSLFNEPAAIENNLKYGLLGMNSELANRSYPSINIIAKKLADYFLMLVSIHPVREGNGRTIRTYFSLFVELNMQKTFQELQDDYILDWSKIDENIFKNVLYEDSINNNAISNEFKKALVPVPKKGISVRI